MRLILLSSLLLLGILLANGDVSESEVVVLSSMIEGMQILSRKVANLQYAFLLVHKARSFASGSERLYVTNKEFNKFEAVRTICENTEGHIPSPERENDNKAFANVLERNGKEAYLVVSDSANFTNWAEGQPNKAEGACVKADTHGVWHSASCDDDLLVVCEFYFSLD